MATFSEGPNSIRKILMQKNKNVHDSVFVLIIGHDQINDLVTLKCRCHDKKSKK